MELRLMVALTIVLLSGACGTEDAITPPGGPADGVSPPSDSGPVLPDAGPTEEASATVIDAKATEPELPRTPAETDADVPSPEPEVTAPPCEDQCPEGSSGCQGAIVWACGPGPGGCLAPAAVEDCNAQGKICVDPGECQLKEGEPGPEEDGIICSQFKGCMIAACGDPPSNECFNTAFNSICVPAAKNMTEVNLYLSLNSCIAANCLSTPSVAAHAECITTSCLAQHAKCFAGTYGEGTCGGIDPCIAEAQCPEDDVVCARPCYEQASEDASALYWTLHLCLYGSCGAAEDPEACEAGAILEGGSCYAQQSTCAADGA